MAQPIYILQPPVSQKARTPCLDDKQFGLGILALASYLRQRGFDVIAMHMPNLLWNGGGTLESLIADIARRRPLLIAIGMNWVHFSRGALDVAALLRRACPQTPIVIGGQHATLFAQDVACFGEGVIDAVIYGEAERTLHELSVHLSEEGTFPRDLPGLLRTDVPRGDRVLEAPAVVEDLDTLPFYDYSTLQKRNGEPDVAALSTCRGGCPYRCAFCVEHVIGTIQGRKKLTFHSAGWIAAHIEHLYRQGIARITIQDSFFIAGDALVCQVADLLARKGVRLDHLNIFAHPGSYGKDGFEAMKTMATKVSIDFGVETGSERVGRAINRPIDGAGIVDQCAVAARSGVTAYTWWLSGLPDAPDAHRDTTDLIAATLRVGAIPRWVSPLILLPRTPMHANCADYGITPRFHSFDDYARFSETSLAEAVHFNDVITHQTEEKDYDGIVDETRKLRQFILDNFTAAEDFWSSEYAGMPEDLGTIKTRIAASFF